METAPGVPTAAAAKKVKKGVSASKSQSTTKKMAPAKKKLTSAKNTPAKSTHTKFVSAMNATTSNTTSIADKA